ncbi:MAG: CDP-alcohol phosphatidyltransferase family protein [Candidatus Marsarchaeota archaeon]|nr:CDP-alcohol phosphatidyltransferase family protein [Candidatus Marsarchaeota archaeon]
MRSADAATILRVLIAVLVVYLVLIKLNPFIILALIIAERIIDALDGYFARREASRGTFGFWTYVNGAVFGNPQAKKLISKYNEILRKTAPHGARFDIAGDRAVEYIFWAVFSYLSLVPLFVFIIVIIRHSFVDALMGSKGTGSKIRSRFARIVYSSNLGRFIINVPKVLAFGYLPFVYIYGWPLWIGYVFIAILVFNILLRGAAEIYESTRRD